LGFGATCTQYEDNLEGLAYFNRAVTHYLMKAYDKAWANVMMCRKLGGTPNPKLIEDLMRVSGRSE